MAATVKGLLDVDAMIDDYNAGQSLPALRREYGISRPSMYWHFLKEDAASPGRVKWRRERKRREVAQQYALRAQIREVMS